MPRNFRFWRNVSLIGLVHVAAVVGLIRWSRDSDKQSAQSIVWLSGTAGNIGAPKAAATPAPRLAKISTPPPEPKEAKREEPNDETPALTPAKSEIQLGTPTPTPRSTATPATTPKPTPKLTPKPVAKITPKPTPKKIVLAKATPKPTPKATPTPSEKETSDTEADAETVKKEIAKAAQAKAEAEKNNPAGPGGHPGGAGGESPFGWYGNMLHDRLYSEWVQPTAAVPSTVKMAVLVKLRIEKDGRVSNFQIIKSSNNVIVDESVAAVAKKVTQVEPLPAGLVKGDHYDVRINFELNSEE